MKSTARIKEGNKNNTMEGFKMTLEPRERWRERERERERALNLEFWSAVS